VVVVAVVAMVVVVVVVVVVMVVVVVVVRVAVAVAVVGGEVHHVFDAPVLSVVCPSLGDFKEACHVMALVPQYIADTHREQVAAKCTRR
jgi:hypothetical protein